MRGLLVLAIVAACAPRHGSAFFTHQDVVPRQILWTAIEATRELHYDVVAVESADHGHAAFLALADSSTDVHTVLLVQIESAESIRVNHARVGCRGLRVARFVDIGTRVSVTPLAFRNGRELSEDQVPLETKDHAEHVMLAIYDRTRSERRLR